MWAFRMFKAVICTAMRSKRSYQEKSRLDLRVFLYRRLRFSISCTLFIWIALWNTEVRFRMGWSAGGQRRWIVVGGVEDALLLSRSTSRLQTWEVGVWQNVNPCKWQGDFLVHVFWCSWWGVVLVAPRVLSWWSGWESIGLCLLVVWNVDICLGTGFFIWKSWL